MAWIKENPAMYLEVNFHRENSEQNLNRNLLIQVYKVIYFLIILYIFSGKV